MSTLDEPDFDPINVADPNHPPVELVAVDADNAPTRRQRIAKSAAQGGAAGAVVVIAAWVARLAGLDLNPDDMSDDLPVEIAAAAQMLLTWLAAARMNPGT